MADLVAVGGKAFEHGFAAGDTDGFGAEDDLLGHQSVVSFAQPRIFIPQLGSNEIGGLLDDGGRDATTKIIETCAKMAEAIHANTFFVAPPPPAHRAEG